MLSVLIYGRNDAYGGTAQRRSALSINALADVLAEDDEIIFVDYNTEDHKLTFPEAIADTLTVRAQGLVKVVRVRPRHHAQLTSAGAAPVVESIARNIGLRHTNAANRWILSTNPDVVLMPPVEGLRALLAGLEDGYYAAPRFELPRMLWQRLPRHDPAAVHAAIDRFAAPLHLDEEVRHYLPELGFDAPGDFQLVLRRDLMAMGGFDEAMQQAWHVDANLMARLALTYGAPGSLAGRLRVYHCEHTADTVAKHSAGRREDSFEDFVTNLAGPIANAGRPWGGEGIVFEIFPLASTEHPDTAEAVAAVIGGPSRGPYLAVYGPESFDQVPRHEARNLTFVMDRLFPLSRSARLIWIGGAGELRARVEQTLARLGFVHPLLDAADPGAMAAADLVLLDNAPADAAQDEVAVFEQQIEALLQAEAERLERAAQPRQVIAINAIHSRLETFLIEWFDVVLSPFTTRLRPALLRHPEARIGSWLGDLSVGDAGARAQDGEAIAIRRGVCGHVFYGPYRRLLTGKYGARVEWVFESGADGRLVLEVVQGETFLAQIDCVLAPDTPTGCELEFVVPQTGRPIGAEPVQIRLWTDGQGAGTVTGVTVSRR
ncbi:hypothetical protein [Novosphingobium arvoryzae]|uniref:Uncharacterized protein n=1 Tax=Novosphingobium arvoryzae TaxID=1256514 RepID=A0A918R6M3_9SPHN|nr:hypothetical protein [Novosphingobium arvoryzae]GGZ85646.1 hypothetical protein GCM10011617_00050 [Novosphingobium arvoryzae]